MENKSWSIHAGFILIFVILILGFYLLDRRIECQVQRTDRLYKMFIDLLKQKNKITRMLS